MMLLKAYYKDFIGHLNYNGYVSNSVSLNHLNPMVVTFYLNKQFTGPVIAIKCPKEKEIILTICGSAASGVDPRDFKNNPMLYEVPHEFSILCMDGTGKEPAPETQVLIQKINKNQMFTDIDTVYYGDLSIKAGCRFKRKEERYYFKYSIILNKGDILKICLICPDINIARTEFLMKCDLNTKEN